MAMQNNEILYEAPSQPIWEAFRTSSIRLILIVFGGTFNMLLAVAYTLSVQPRYAYAGHTSRSISTTEWIGIGVLSLLPILRLPVEFRRPSDYGTWVIYLVCVAPLPFVSSQTTNVGGWTYLATSLAVIVAFLLFDFVRVHFPIVISNNLSRRVLPEGLFTQVLPIFVVVSATYMWSITQFSFNLDLYDVYERRLDARVLAPAFSLLGYLIAFVANAGIPFLISTGVIARKPLLILIGVYAAVATFGFSGSKSHFMMPLLIAFVLTLSRHQSGYHALYLIIGVCGLIVAALVEEFVFGTFNLTALFVSRILITPSLLTQKYFEFFSVNELVLMRDSVFRFFAESPYPLSMARMIGLAQFGNADTNANASIFATSFGDFGYVGLIGIPAIAGIVLRLFDVATSRFGYRFACVAFRTP
jgi:membrane protease YdiL (CAAX protease family)